ncbi:competence protein ComG [Bacillus sp. AFS018417]|uniref:competence type IV pilus minor pilin ComGG n=1 Tax=unclassified Bacillus (in: firmicutes) TaxID=185979 RepID=UPI000BF2E51F|nr:MULTISPECIES: competence type IV pilus minor pilin ComGG [unclassified Bacillus (in: firmicutes)]MCP1125145.1 ComGG family competence protein [Bacillus sp. 3103sda1]PEZ07738.1 competence protein ComG [Bacillus sp. AFS018417]
MRSESGFTMPGTIILILLLMSFFVYETNIFLSDQKFYAEAEELFILEEITDQAIAEVKQELKTGMEKRTFFYTYEKGEAKGDCTIVDGDAFITLQCITKRKLTYKVSFRYNTNNEAITNWQEERL